MTKQSYTTFLDQKKTLYAAIAIKNWNDKLQFNISTMDMDS